MTSTKRGQTLLAAASLFSAAAGVGASMVVSVLAGGAPTPVAVVGSRVIDALPGTVGGWAVLPVTALMVSVGILVWFTCGRSGDASTVEETRQEPRLATCGAGSTTRAVSPTRRVSTTRAVATSGCAVALLSVVGCSGVSGDASAATGRQGASGSSSVGASSDGTSTGTPDLSTDLVGPGCQDYAESVPNGPGSVAGMATDRLTTAVGDNPLLTSLMQAVSGELNPKVNLVDDLNHGKLTVFAPIDAAFAKLDAKTLEDLSSPSHAKELTKLLTYHVVGRRIAPAQIDGMQESLEGGALKVTRSGDNIKVNGAHVICGGVQTANATVYLIDTVLTPPTG